MSGLTQKKASRMEKAAKLKWAEDMTHKEIANQLDLAKSTIDQYFSSDHMKNFQRIWTDKDKFELQRALEQQLYDIEKEATEYLREGARHPEASAADRIRASKEYMNLMKKKVELLQEMGVIQKPKERKEEVHKTEHDKVMERLQEAHHQLKQQKEEAEAEEA